MDAQWILGLAPSRPGPGDPSSEAFCDAESPGTREDAEVSRPCLWCREPLHPRQLRWCSKRCRQTAWRSRRLSVVEDLGDTPKRLGYADPPFPGLARRYYRNEATFGGEVDHRRLLEELATFDGWALSTSAKALRDVLPLCPPEARVCAWVKPNGVPRSNRGISNVWEPLIVVPARRRPPGVPDFLRAKPARGGGTLMGRKPIAFCAWLFALLGAGRNDSIEDLFPGTGIVGRCWEEFRRQRVAHTGVRDAALTQQSLFADPEPRP